MNIPNLPIEKKFVTQDGNIHPAWFNVLVQLMSELQQNMSNEGYKLPQQTSANVALLDNTNSTGAILYNQETNQFIGNVNGVFKTFLS